MKATGEHTVRPSWVKAPSRSWLVALVLTASSCGIEIGNPKKPKDNPPTTSVVTYMIDDRTVAGGLISSQADQVVTTAAEEVALNPLGLGSSPQSHVALDGDGGAPPSNTAGSFPVPARDDPSSATVAPLGTVATLTPALGTATTGAKPTCTQTSPNAAVVQMHTSGPANHGFDNAGRHNSYAASMREETSTLSWQSPNQAVPCNTDKTSVAIDWATADGLTLNAVFSDNRSMTVSRQGPTTTFNRAVEMQLSGVRTASWAADAAGSTAAALSLKKTVTSQLTQTLTTRRHTGEQVIVSSTIQVQPDAPIVLNIVRDRTTQAWQSKTIVSGVVTTTSGTDSRVVATYANLVFTVKAGCAPVSGTVTGAIYRGADATAFNHYSINFADSVGTITYDDGTTDTYVPAYCDLDDGIGGGTAVMPH